MSHTIQDMSPAGRKVLQKMQDMTSHFDVLLTIVGPAFALKKLLESPIEQLMDLVLPAPSEWDVLTEYVKQSGNLKDLLRKKLSDIYILDYQMKNGWNAADKQFIESFYNAATGRD